MPAIVQIRVSPNLSLRDPEGTDLGRKIVSDGIMLINDIGYDAFTFKKLAKKIDSTEASVYRYFKSKKHFLQYLVAWYWNWLEYLIDYKTNNIKNSKKKLEITLEVLAECDQYDPTFSHIDEAVLHNIVVAESARVYLTREDEKSSKKEVFKGYRNLCDRIAKILKEINPRYKFHTSLSSTIVAIVHKQTFIHEHTTFYGKADKGVDTRKMVREFVKHLVLSTLEK